MRTFFNRRWVKILFLVITSLILAGFVYLGHQLYTTMPGMYNTTGVQPSLPANPLPRVADTSITIPTEALVYTSLRPTNWDIYLFEEPGTPPRQLTKHPNLDYNATFSPDGKWVVFTSERDGNANLYALQLALDVPPIRLTQHPGMDDAPAFSPDGKQLAFVSTRDGNPDIFLMPFRPGNLQAEEQAVNLTHNPYGDFNPAFSSDGQMIAFSSNRDIFRRWNPVRLIPLALGMTHLYVIGVDGTGLRRIVSDLGINGSPAWSANGNSLLYHKVTTFRDSRVYQVDIEHGQKKPLTPAHLFALTPVGSANDSIIFVGIDWEQEQKRTPYRETHGGGLYFMAQGDTALSAISTTDRNYLSPDYDLRTGRIVCHGDGPTESLPLMANETPFTWPDADRAITLPERLLLVRPLRGYFPSISQKSEQTFVVQWVHEHKGNPTGPSPIISAGLNGETMKTIYLPPDSGFVWTPVITRDEQWIFFSKGPRFAGPAVDVDIWKVPTHGGVAVNLTADSKANDAFPDVSADGTRIVFRSGRTGNHEVYVMDQDGKNVRCVSNHKGTDTMPAISPDGKWVTYTTDRTGHGMKLWMQSLDNPDDEGRLLEPDRAHLTGLDMHPRFSPDGKWIIFTSDRAGFMDEFVLSGFFPQPYGELYALPADGSSPAIRLTHDKWEDALPFWGYLNSKKIASSKSL